MPRWLTDEKIRTGNRALHLLDRAAEERIQLTTEASNMCRWFSRELYALEAMRTLPQCELLTFFRSPQHDLNLYSVIPYKTLVDLRISDHLHLATLWANPFVSNSTFQQCSMQVQLHMRGSTDVVTRMVSNFTTVPNSTDTTSSIPEVPDNVSEGPDESEEQTADAVYLTDIITENTADLSDEEDIERSEDELTWQLPVSLPVRIP